MKKPRILVPTDFSDLSLIAFPNALAIARLLDGKITPFHAYMQMNDLDGFYFMGETSPESDLRTLEKNLHKRLAGLSEKYFDEGIYSEPVVKIGNAARCISETASDYDLIVMSSHGRTGFTRLILGSVCNKVLRTSPAPVLVIEEESRLMPLHRILLTTDFSENSLYAFEPAAAFARAANAKIDLVHIVSFEQFDTFARAQHDSQDRKLELDHLARKYLGDLEEQLHTEVIYTEKSVSEEIIRLTKAHPYNLVVMATIGRTGLDYMMLGSTAASILHHVKTPVLSIKPDTAG